MYKDILFLFSSKKKKAKQYDFHLLLETKASLCTVISVKRPDSFLYLWLTKILKYEQYYYPASIFLQHMWEFVLRDQGKTKICHFLFLPLMNSMTKHFLDLTSPAAYAVFLFLGITHTEQASFPRKKHSEGPRPACAAGLSAARTI